MPGSNDENKQEESSSQTHSNPLVSLWYRLTKEGEPACKNKLWTQLSDKLTGNTGAISDLKESQEQTKNVLLIYKQLHENHTEIQRLQRHHDSSFPVPCGEWYSCSIFFGYVTPKRTEARQEMKKLQEENVEHLKRLQTLCMKK